MNENTYRSYNNSKKEVCSFNHTRLYLWYCSSVPGKKRYFSGILVCTAGSGELRLVVLTGNPAQHLTFERKSD